MVDSIFFVMDAVLAGAFQQVNPELQRTALSVLDCRVAFRLRRIAPRNDGPFFNVFCVPQESCQLQRILF